MTSYCAIDLVSRLLGEPYKPLKFVFCLKQLATPPQLNRLLLYPIRTFSFLGAFISVPFFEAIYKKEFFRFLFPADIRLKRRMKFDFFHNFRLLQDFYLFNFVLKFTWQQAFKHFGTVSLHRLAAPQTLNQDRFLV